ncbi:MAG: flippase [Desulfobacterales bacterium]|nr:flippase [Desulfobacterales bacterium]
MTNISWLLGYRLLNMIVTLAVGVYVARYLGPERLGFLSYALSFVGLFTALATLGIDNIVIRELVKTPDRKNILLGTAFGIKAFGAVVMWAAISFAILFTRNDGHTNFIIFIIASGVIFQSFDVIDLHYQARVESRYVVYARLIQLSATAVTKLIFVWIAAPLIWFAFLFVLESAIHAIALTAVYRRNSGAISSWKWHSKTAGVILKAAWPLILAAVLHSCYMRIDQVMIKEIAGLAHVGYYSAAVKLCDVWAFVPMAIASSLFPVIINSKKENQTVYHQRLQHLYGLMICLAVVIALPTTFLAPQVIRILYGEAFMPAAGVLSIYIWTGMFTFLGVANGRWIVVENVQYISVWKTAGAAILNIALNFVLIPRYGINGAAVSSIAAVFFAFHLSFALFKETRINFTLQNRAFMKPYLWLGSQYGLYFKAISRSLTKRREG